MENEVGRWRVALLAHDLAGRDLTDEEVAGSIRWVDSLLHLRQNCLSRGDTQTVKYLDQGIRERCDEVDEENLNKAREHLERYDAARGSDST
jgi:hypothetical protein